MHKCLSKAEQQIKHSVRFGKMEIGACGVLRKGFTDTDWKSGPAGGAFKAIL